MENQKDSSESNQNKELTAKLFEKSAELKKKNAQVLEKLEVLKKQADKLFNTKTVHES